MIAFCIRAILAWCFEKPSQAHHCLILGNWTRLNFLRSHARLTSVTPRPYHTAQGSWCNWENNSYQQALFVSFSQFNTSLSSSVFPHNRSPLEKEMAKRSRLPPFLSFHLSRTLTFFSYFYFIELSSGSLWGRERGRERVFDFNVFIVIKITWLSDLEWYF